MTLRTLIIDDEPPARKRLRDLLEGEDALAIVGEAEDGPAAVEQILELQPDLVLLDIQMPGLDGFEVLSEVSIRSNGGLPAIIFVTAHDDYALRAFEEHAIDYLLKPFDQDRLTKSIEKAVHLAGNESLDRRLNRLLRQAADQRPLRRIMVKEPNRSHFVDIGTIDYFESDGHYVILHVGEEQHLVRESLRQVYARLDPSQFGQIHRSRVVNLDRIMELRPESHGDFEVVLKDGVRLHGTRRYARSLEERMS